MSEATILIIEDDEHIRKFLRISLVAHHYKVLEARLGEEGLGLCAARQPGLVILDLGLPDMDGSDVLRTLREWSNVPVIVLSVRAAESEKITMLDLGANDYVTKPFGIGELLARVRSLLRNREPGDEMQRVLKADGLEMNLLSREVRRDGELVQLARKEYDLLRLLMSEAGRVLTHRQILTEIWGADRSEETHYLRVLVRQLRLKLGDNPTAPRFIQTVQGVGYRLAVHDD